MNYGFVIDNRVCIGCHACSTACKSENQVPLGVHRTWVKTLEHGQYPDVRRSFQVTRCNHCANPPCVRICPTRAMYLRHDGIVEFDGDSCIGCKSCVQACPYDAIYIDPDSGTAAKCHYCAHRVEVGLEPACAVVCPVHAIIAGDMDDPSSEISRMIAAHPTTVRKPEQGTAPKVLYIDGSDLALHPTVFARPPRSLAATDVLDLGAGDRAHRLASPDDRALPSRPDVAEATGATARSGVALRAPQTQGVPGGGPIRVGQGRFAEHMVQLDYDAQHRVPWHWPVPAYLVTKSVAAGVFLLIALGTILDLFPFDSAVILAGGGVGLVALAATTGLLIYDLERPARFLYILLYPQWQSWLTRGAFVLIAFAIVAGGWWLAEGAVALGWLAASESLRVVGIWLTLPLAVGAAVYTGFLFAQAEGRDLWQSPLLPLHLVIQSGFMGAATFLVIGQFVDLGPALGSLARAVFSGGVIASLFVICAGEFAVPHASEVAARAAREIRGGRHRHTFWLGAVVIGHVLPLALIASGSEPLAPWAAISATIGLYAYEYAFVMAPQEIPNS